MIEPALKDDAFLADVQAADDAALNVWWLGQSGYLLKHAGRHVLIDPYLSDSLTKKYAETDKPHERMTGLIVDPARLDFVDAATSSHNHTDHLDAETLKPLLAANADLAVVVPAANVQFASERLGVPPDRLTPAKVGEPVEAKGMTFHPVPAAHDELETDEHGRQKFVGYVIELGERTVYHSGDTRPYEGMVDALRAFEIDLAMLPINGWRPERRVAGNLWGREAAKFAHDIGAGLVVPCHYDMFTFNTEPPTEFVNTCDHLGQPCRVLECGERLVIK